MMAHQIKIKRKGEHPRAYELRCCRHRIFIVRAEIERWLSDADKGPAIRRFAHPREMISFRLSLNLREPNALRAEDKGGCRVAVGLLAGRAATEESRERRTKHISCARYCLYFRGF